MKSWDRVAHRQNNLNFDGLDQIEIYKGRKDPTMCKKTAPVVCLQAVCEREAVSGGGGLTNGIGGPRFATSSLTTMY